MKKRTIAQRNRFRYSFFIKIVIFLAAWVTLIVGAIYDKDVVSSWYTQYQEGEPADKDIYSPFNFSFVNKDETAQKRLYERERVEDVYVRDTQYASAVTKQLENLFALTSEDAEAADSRIDDDIAEGVLPSIDSSIVRAIIEDPERAQFQTNIQQFIAAYLTREVITLAQKIELFKNGRSSIAVKDGTIMKSVPVTALATLDEQHVLIRKSADELYGKDRKLRNAYIELLTALLKPDLQYNAELTERQRREAFENTQPVYDRVQKGEVVIRKGQIITNNDLARLNEIEKMRAQKEVFMTIVGIGIISFIALWILFTALRLFENPVFQSAKKLVVICVVVVTVFIISKVLLSLSSMPDLLPMTPLASVVVAILISPRAGIIVAVVETFLVGSITQFDPLFMLLGLSAGIIALYPTIGLRKRSQFALVGIYVAVVNFTTMFGYYITSGANIYEAFTVSVNGLVGGLVIFFALIGATWLFEHVFDITTDIRLLELSDLNQPLLRRLVIEAPGTYHHSLVVSNLAENACEEVGANSLLARVGCYYHDIGKISKAEYFTENQTSKDQNIHDKLTPAMSSMLIVNHVKDGIDLARRYKLKNEIVDFIEQHHGQSVIYFFYKRAQELMQEGGAVSIDDFRYPGPKPQTKEIAVSMLADAVEAASRSLPSPSPDSITELVDKVVNDKFMDGQLDECSLTMRDLRKIKESFARNLMGIFHTRIEYPEINTPSGV